AVEQRRDEDPQRPQQMDTVGPRRLAAAEIVGHAGVRRGSEPAADAGRDHVATTRDHRYTAFLLVWQRSIMRRAAPGWTPAYRPAADRHPPRAPHRPPPAAPRSPVACRRPAANPGA